MSNDRLSKALGVQFCATCDKEIPIINSSPAVEPHKVNNDKSCISLGCNRAAFVMVHFQNSAFDEFVTVCEFCYNKAFTEHHRA